MSLDTEQLLHKLSQTTDIKQFIAEHEADFLDLSGTQLLNRLCSRKRMSVAAVAMASGQGEYVYKVFRGERRPSRDVMVSIAVGMGATMDEAQLLLRVSKLAMLDPKDRRDSVILYALKQGLAVQQLNELLYDVGENTL